MIAGLLPNTPQNLAQWIRTPQTFVPGNAMPNIAVSPREAADMAAYLETLD
jgi:cytochrome c1